MSRDDFYASPFGAFYSAYMERPWLARRISRLVWGGDTGAYYASMKAIAGVREGGTIVDCPCGAGAAFQTVRPAASVRYVAVDLSPSMLARARTRAEAAGLVDLELVRAEATDIPLTPSSADLFLSFWGLHCFDDPRRRSPRPRGSSHPADDWLDAPSFEGSKDFGSVCSFAQDSGTSDA